MHKNQIDYLVQYQPRYMTHGSNSKMKHASVHWELEKKLFHLYPHDFYSAYQILTFGMSNGMILKSQITEFLYGDNN